MSAPGVDEDDVDEDELPDGDVDLDERAADVLDGEFVTFEEHEEQRE